MDPSHTPLPAPLSPDESAGMRDAMTRHAEGKPTEKKMTEENIEEAPKESARGKRSLLKNMLTYFGVQTKKEPDEQTPHRPSEAPARSPAPPKDSVRAPDSPRRKLAKAVAVTASSRRRRTDLSRRSARPAKPASAFPLGDMPQDQNIVGARAFPFVFEEREHTIQFRGDGLFLDGLKYKLLAEALSEMELSLLGVTREGFVLTIRAGTWGRELTLTANAQHIDDMLHALLGNRPFATQSDDGMTLRIERQMY